MLETRTASTVSVGDRCVGGFKASREVRVVAEVLSIIVSGTPASPLRCWKRESSGVSGNLGNRGCQLPLRCQLIFGEASSSSEAIGYRIVSVKL